MRLRLAPQGGSTGFEPGMTDLLMVRGCAWDPAARRRIMCAIVWGWQHRRGQAALDSERFRSDPRTYWPARGRLNVGPTGSAGRCRGHYWWRLPDGRKPHVRHETARFHHTSRRRGGVAARGAGAFDLIELNGDDMRRDPPVCAWCRASSLVPSQVRDCPVC